MSAARSVVEGRVSALAGAGQVARVDVEQGLDQTVVPTSRREPHRPLRSRADLKQAGDDLGLPTPHRVVERQPQLPGVKRLERRHLEHVEVAKVADGLGRRTQKSRLVGRGVLALAVEPRPAVQVVAVAEEAAYGGGGMGLAPLDAPVVLWPVGGRVADQSALEHRAVGIVGGLRVVMAAGVAGRGIGPLEVLEAGCEDGIVRVAEATGGVVVVVVADAQGRAQPPVDGHDAVADELDERRGGAQQVAHDVARDVLEQHALALAGREPLLRGADAQLFQRHGHGELGCG